MKMLVDYHTHILPELDDGAKDLKTSLEMLEILKNQGVKQIIATPHFYAHREKSVEHFLEKRQRAFEKINSNSPLPIMLGAEIAIEHNISEIKDIEKLAIQGTKLILLELPYRKHKDWMSEEIYNISAEYGLKVILAHIHRYLEYYSKEQIQQILSTDAVFQINNEAFASLRERRFVKALIKQERSLVLGSDCHNIADRKPNWNLLKRRSKSSAMELSNGILDKYKL